jgi:protein-disulfide isomerase
MKPMKVRTIFACAAAVVALAGCNKNKSESNTAVAEDKVTITQATPPPGGTWSDVVNATSAGYMMGNPNAKVKLIEYGSLFCPYCKNFEDNGSPLLVENYVKPGKVSWEFRPYVIHGPIDVAANIVARCAGTKAFFPLTKALYKDQTVLEEKFQAVPQDKVQEMQNLPTNQVFVAMGNALGLQDWAAARGVPQAKSNQCLSDQKMIDREVQLTGDVNQQYPDFPGTPAFVINGKMYDIKAGGTPAWDQLKVGLDEALK